MNLPRVSVERVVSGRGIESIYSFLRSREPSLESPVTAELFAAHARGHQVDMAAEVSTAAMAKQDRLCEKAMRLFIAAYGAEAGNLALKLLPRGGLYVAGGIAAKILPLIREGAFLDSFLAKGRMRPELERIPVHVVLDANVGLIGATRYACRLVAP
jgi:glucokinase